ncbi:hypothetical protein ACFVT5_36890 [Streptomyces sp. NPDC058001]|uniref:hypothetical protein n=1 Tax=Streptomyces sp. NPDC058001 TaxID=3346300 RepID=UPI0036E881E2
MSRRVSLPGADELFRTTGGMALQASTPRRPPGGEPRVPAPAGESDEAAAEDTASRTGAQHDEGTDGAEHTAADAEPGTGESRTHTPDRAGDRDDDAPARAGRRQLQDGTGGSATVAAAGTQSGRPANAPSGQARRRGRGSGRRPSGRERHDEKITVYVSAEELMDLEHARLVLRGEHGLAVDRGRIVREAVAVVLADLESRGDASILVRRLRGR